jgi:hypothetical protein
VSELIGIIVSNKLATYSELDTILGLEDMYDLIEILTIDAYNARIDQ